MRPCKPYPQALQLAAGEHRLCGCRQSRDWPRCTQDRSDCAHCRHSVSLPQPRFVWLCQCGHSRELPYCDGEGHIAAAKQCGDEPAN